MRPLIGRGERAPDFALPRTGEDDATRFYGVAGGRTAVVLLAAGASGGRIADVADRLEATHGDDLDVHVVIPTGDGAPAGAFHDRTGEVHRAYGVPASEEPVAIVVDANLRVVATSPVDGAAESAEAIAHALPSDPPDHSPAPRLAPVLFVPDALDTTLCGELMERWETEGAVETGVETVVEGDRAEATDLRRKRRRDIVVTDGALLRRLTQHVGSRVFPELHKAFAFRAGGFEGFKVGCYTAEDGGHFEAHRDNLSAGTAHRRFGISVNLNDAYTGGELRFPEYGPTRYRPDAGEALVFSGSHLHEVLPVASGRRFVLLSFILARRGESGDG